MTCDYYGCNEPVCDDSLKLIKPGSQKHCQKHYDEFDCLIKKKDAKGMLQFWVRSLGGAKMAAKKMSRLRKNQQKVDGT